MLQVNENTPQQQVIILPKKITLQGGVASNNSTDNRSSLLHEDIISLSSQRSLLISDKKGPSKSVTPAESRALRDGFSIYA